MFGCEQQPSFLERTRKPHVSPSGSPQLLSLDEQSCTGMVPISQGSQTLIEGLFCEFGPAVVPLPLRRSEAAAQFPVFTVTSTKQQRTPYHPCQSLANDSQRRGLRIAPYGHQILFDEVPVGFELKAAQYTETSGDSRRPHPSAEPRRTTSPDHALPRPLRGAAAWRPPCLDPPRRWGHHAPPLRRARATGLARRARRARGTGTLGARRARP